MRKEFKSLIKSLIESLKKNGYTTMLLQAKNEEVLVFYKSSLSEETIIFGIQFPSDSRFRYISVGCLSKGVQGISLGCYTGVKKSDFNEENMFKCIDIVENEVTEHYSIDFYDIAMRHTLKFTDAEQTIDMYCQQHNCKKIKI